MTERLQIGTTPPTRNFHVVTRGFNPWPVLVIYISQTLVSRRTRPARTPSGDLARRRQAHRQDRTVQGSSPSHTFACLRPRHRARQPSQCCCSFARASADVRGWFHHLTPRRSTGAPVAHVESIRDACKGRGPNLHQRLDVTTFVCVFAAVVAQPRQRSTIHQADHAMW